MRKVESKTLVTLLCERCKGHAVVDGIPYPTGPADVLFCPFCGTKVETRSAFLRKWPWG